jgi:hypothetical protein
MRLIDLRQHRAALRKGWNRKQRKQKTPEFQDSRQHNPPGRHTTSKKKRAQPRRARIPQSSKTVFSAT